MSVQSELSLVPEDYDKAFTEVSFLLDMFIETIVTFVGKSTPALAVAAGRKMAGNLPVHIVEGTPEEAVSECVRVFKIQQMEIEGSCEAGKGALEINHCPLGEVCRNRDMELGGQACQMFHYYIAGILAELSGRPTRPVKFEAGEKCTIQLAFAGGRSSV